MSEVAVIGGTYFEDCAEPAWNRMVGSGFRGAKTLSAFGAKVQFKTVTDERNRDMLALSARKDGIEVETIGIATAMIRFSYSHPLATPAILPWNAGTTISTVVEAPVILKYGMLESSVPSKSKTLVYDPQSKYNPRPVFEGRTEADQVAIVANMGELIHLTGETTRDAIFASLHNDRRIKCVVMKAGAEGAFVSENGHVAQVPPHRTEKVWKIGSGDVFSAVFTNYWALDAQAGALAAANASLATAIYCNTQSIPNRIKLEAAKVSGYLPLTVKRRANEISVYLAGPFFTMPQRWLINEARGALIGFGFRVFSPYHDVGLGSAEEVVKKDVEALEAANLVYGLLDGADPGTVFEIGFARARGIPTVIFAQNESEESLKMIAGTGCRIVNDFAGSLYTALWDALG